MSALPSTEGTLVGIPEIASIAGVQRSAVSNWRKRHPDFPHPAVETPSGLLFDLGLVELWLFEHGKVTTPISATSILWRFINATQSEPGPLRDFLISALVYLEACDRAQSGGVIRVADADRWSSIDSLPEAELGARLRMMLARIEEENEQLRGLLLHGVASPGAPPMERQLELLGHLDFVSRDSETPRFELFEEVVARTHQRARFTEEHATPDGLALLLAKLAGEAERVFDPACGEGGVLLMTAVASDLPGQSTRELIGWEVDADALRLARARFFLYGIDAELSLRDSLTAAPNELPSADAVLLDPPYGVRQWGNPDIYRDTTRWPFGTPPPNSANLAWLQLAAASLKRGGMAFVLLPASELARGGREQGIRQSMLESGAVDAVVVLPARLRRDTSIPLSLWCMRPPKSGGTDGSILLVDASQIGRSSRSTVSLEEEDVELLAQTLGKWFDDRAIDTADTTITAVVVTIADVEEARLVPAHYVPKPQVDRRQLSREREVLVEELRDGASVLASVLRAVIKGSPGE